MTQYKLLMKKGKQVVGLPQSFNRREWFAYAGPKIEYGVKGTVELFWVNHMTENAVPFYDRDGDEINPELFS